jgi:hypothetical protein
MLNNNPAGLFKLGRALLLLYFILLIYDGALRKWLFPTYEKYIFFIKDFVFLSMLALSLYLLRTRKTLALPKWLKAVMLIYAFCVVANAINPNLPSLLIGGLGIKLHLMHMLLVLMLGILYEKIEGFIKDVTKILPILIIPVCLIGFAQVYAPQDSILNQAVRGGLNSVPNMRDLTRASGTFSYVTGFGAFLIAAFSIALASNIPTKFKINISLIVLIIVISSLPTNGSRAVLMSAAGIGVLTIVGVIWKKLLEPKVAVKILSYLGVAITLVIIANPDPWQALLHRFLTSYHLPGETARFHSGITNAFSFFSTAGLYGFGTGSASQLAPFLVSNVHPYSWLPPTVAQIGFEEESGRVVLELGVIGWISSMLMRITFLYYSVHLILKAQLSTSILVGIVSTPILALGVMFGTGVFSPPIGAAYYWLCVAMMIKSNIEERDLQAT